jgi:hypothetical protein
MRYKVGRLLQLGGLLILPMAVAGVEAGKLTQSNELALLGVGVVVFFAGWLLQQSSRPQ